MDSIGWMLGCMLVCVSVGQGISCPDGCSCTSDLTACIDQDFTDIPDGIPTNTQKLFLKGLKITILKENAFQTLTQLKTLDATQCEIKVVEPNAFKGLVNLASLDLKSNKITELKAFTFSGLPALKTLSLEGNQIEVIDNQALNHLNLTSLNLEKNENLREIAPKAFADANIQRLRIFKSALSSQSAQALKPLQASLRELSWEFNTRPLSLSEDLFQGFTLQRLTLIENGIRDASFLKHVITDDLSLVGNPIGSIDFSQYPNLKQVRTLSLDNTGFSDPDGRYFEDMTHLSQLLLASNGITSLPENLRKVFDRVQILQLQHNEFHCNCELWWFKQWADQHGEKVTGARCATSVAGDMVMIKNKEEFLCTPPTAPKITQDISTSGNQSHVTLTCVSEGDPAPTIIWKQNGYQLSRAPPSFNRTITENRGILPLNSADSEKAVKHTCVAVNIAGNATTTTSVDVYKVLNEAEHSKNKPTSGAISSITVNAHVWTSIILIGMWIYINKL